jgi:hypothetical protein
MLSTFMTGLPFNFMRDADFNLHAAESERKLCHDDVLIVAMSTRISDEFYQCVR